MLDLYVEILKLTNEEVEMLDRGKEFMDELTEVVSKFFKSIVKMLEKLCS
jgi:predicted RNA-binding protein associated with RNAse of E/G family